MQYRIRAPVKQVRKSIDCFTSRYSWLLHRFLFLLDQKGFIDLISAQKPLAIVSEALYLIHSLVVNGKEGKKLATVLT